MSKKKRRRIFKPFRRASRPGAVPGTIRPAADAPPPLIDLFAYDEHRVHRAKNVTAEEVARARGSARVVWINVSGLGDADVIRSVGQTFGLHELALEDVVNVHQRAKVEEFEHYLFVVARMVRNHQERLESEQFSLFIGSNFIVTFQEHVGDCFNGIRNRLRSPESPLRSRGPDFLAYALLDAVIDAYFAPIEAFGESLERIEDELEIRPTPELVGQLHQIRSDLLLLRRSIWPQREAINNLLRDDNRLITRDTRLFLRDVYDHTVQLVDVTETYRELCADLRELHYARIGHRTNEVMKVLTIISTIFMPLSFITGLYGMNFDTSASPFNMPELHARYGYPMALAAMATTAGILLYFFRRRGWLHREI
ncbi:magnesium/cobalt transporter CorA [Candidatus Laterigemmans baculatus]|uniref:magnesium/cobalt transporter CorA n=1 Tax=Candidatus Laterigemmans baculatus TaxID=2770505 RepID=UPI0013DAA66B|nr:magnesium/cobalt transporter CorA [Candidatus Laterigemmans baculatus]